MSEQPPSEASQTVHELELQRRANRDEALGLGLRPYGDRVDGLVALAEAASLYDGSADEDHQKNGKSEGFVDRRPSVKVAGRVMLLRDNGKLIWMNLRDESGDLQIAVSKRDCDGTGFSLAKLTDLGDIVVASGRLMKTRTGEVTVWCETLGAGAKCLVPPPEKHAGLQDVELRYRQRYIDMWSNPETVRVFKLRSEIIGALRGEMARRGYTEVETPMLQAQAGGAAARPFTTHMNALDMDLYLRIAPELYLKRLLVGGLSKVFEINRNFRNEGLDKQHNPEFTMLEAYCAFGDVETVMELTESLVRVCAQRVGELTGGGAALAFGDLTIDYEKDFRRTAYGELFERALGFDMADTGRARDEAKRRNIRTSNDKGEEIDDAFVVNELFEAFAEPLIDPSEPTFITHYPAAISPLTRANVDNPLLSDRADLFIGGMEIAPNYTELNDPDVQAERFRSQLVGIADDEATFRTFDEDFVRALRVGMPPAGGMGLGVDRLAMLLTDQRTIRDVILFPLLRRSSV
ncbi:MAG: lysine--tRNA ligase [Phycisphaerales bacterium]|nr:MAG: lysine--tRNA ligase [Phycisphaerales bacterium]